MSIRAAVGGGRFARITKEIGQPGRASPLQAPRKPRPPRPAKQSRSLRTQSLPRCRVRRARCRASTCGASDSSDRYSLAPPTLSPVFPTPVAKSFDAASTLYSPVDAFSTKPLETTANGAIGAGDSTIGVASTMGGFAATYGILSIDNELIVYAETTATQSPGGRRGALGTAPPSHIVGVPVL